MCRLIVMKNTKYSHFHPIHEKNQESSGLKIKYSAQFYLTQNECSGIIFLEQTDELLSVLMQEVAYDGKTS